MKIFGKTVVGLFDNDQDVDKAVTALQKLGFGKEDDEQIKVIDQHRLPGESPVEQTGQRVVAPTAPGSGQTGGVAVPTPADRENTEAAETSVKNTLTSLGVGAEEASYFAMQVVRKDSKLVIVETSADQAQQALEAMKEVPSQAALS